MRNIVWRLMLFYLLAIAIMVAMVPCDQATTALDLSGIPFVTAFSAARVPFGAWSMYLMVLNKRKSKTAG